MEKFRVVDSSWGNDETNAISIEVKKDNWVRVMCPSEEYNDYVFAQNQEECEESIATYLEKFEGEEISKSRLIKILNQIK